MPTLCLAPPLLPAHAVLRPGLVRELERASRRQLTLLVGPKGAGKTLLLGQWGAAHDHAVAWVRPERGTAAAELAEALVRAAGTVIDGTAAGTAELVEAEGDRLGRRFLHAFAQAAGTLPPAVLVVDGLDALPDRLGADLVSLAESLPPQVRLVLSGRRRPPAALHRLQARGELSELTGDHLRFADEETAALLAAAIGTSPEPRDVALLQRRTEGRAALLSLAAAALRATTDRASLLGGLATAPDVAAHLWQRLWDHLESDDQQVLTVLAQLEHAAMPLVEELLPTVEVDRRLDAIAASTPELLQADVEQPAYRLHPVAIELLRADATAVTPIERSGVVDANLVLRGAARWHRDRDEPGLAARYLHRAEAWSDLVALVAEEQQRGVSGHLPAHWAAWVSIPHLLDQPDEAPTVIGALAGAGKFHEARRLCRLLGDVRPRPTWLGTVEAALDLLAADRAHDPEAVLAECDHLETIVRTGDAALLPPAGAAHHFDRPGLTAAAALWRGRARLQQGRNDEALVAYGFARRATDPATAQVAAFEQAIALAWIGRLAAAEHTAQSVLDKPDESRSATIPAELAVVRAIVSLARGELTVVDRTLDATERSGAGWPAALAMWDVLVRAEAALLDGDLDRAASLLVWDQPEPHIGPFSPLAGPSVEHRLLPPPVLADQRAALAARVQLARGQVSAARLALREGPQLTSGLLVSALVALATGDLEGTRRELQGLGGLADRHRRERDVLLALLQHSEGDEHGARRLLLETAERSADDGDLRPFLFPGSLVLPLLRRAAPADETGLLDAALDRIDRRDGVSVQAHALNPVVASLSRRELELLPLLPTHLTVSDIAERLYISTNTAKTHLRHIYRKLGVGNRRAAVARSTELGLIEGWRG